MAVIAVKGTISIPCTGTLHEFLEVKRKHDYKQAHIYIYIHIISIYLGLLHYSLSNYCSILYHTFYIYIYCFYVVLSYLLDIWNWIPPNLKAFPDDDI